MYTFDGQKLGDNGFYWWVGVVEDRHDPKQLGRCRVRIVGKHTEDKVAIPTESLPWAFPLLPLNTPAQTAPLGPIEGTWIRGFFLDGASSQIPVMEFIIPGFNKQSSE